MHTYPLSLVGDLVLAAADPQAPSPKSIPEIIDGLRLWIIMILAGVATLFLVISGLQRMTAAGDPGQIEQAKHNFKNALGGYALAVLAPVILEVFQSILGG